MKKQLFLKAIWLLLPLLWLGRTGAAQSTITITSPAANQSVAVGTGLNIIWNFTPLGGNLDIFTVELLIGGEFYRTVTTNATAGVATFVLPNDLPSRNDYRVRVSRTNRPTDVATSAANFTITGGRFLSITSPVGGENFLKGQLVQVTWSTNAPGNLQIDLLRDGNLVETIANNLSPTTSPFTWSIPTRLPDANNYRLRITNLSDRFVAITNASNFTIGRTLRVSAPNGGEVLSRGSSVNITWAANTSENVRIELNRGGARAFRVIESATLGTPAGTRTWVVPNDIPDGINYRVRINNTVDSTIFDESDANFIIGNYILFRAPGAGENVFRNTPFTIRWESNVPGDARIELLRSGSIVTVIAPSIALSAGSFVWAVPDLLEASNYTIRIVSLTTSSSAESANFAVTSPFITLSSPMGGELWNKGRNNTIRWLSNVGGNVRIDLTSGGNVVAPIVTSTPNNGSFDWNIPTAVVNSNAYRVRITSLSLLTVGESPGNFSIIDPATVSVVAPNGGERLQRGRDFTIRWQNNFTENVRVELLRAGNPVQTILNSVPSTPSSAVWSVPTTLAVANDYRVRVTSVLTSTVTGQSAADFSIAEADSLTLLAPNGGERLIRGNTTNIRWRTNFTGSIVIELLQGANVVATISNNAPNTGTFAWVVPENVGVGEGDYRIRIRTADNSVSDNSDAPFSLIIGIFQFNVPVAGETWFRGLTYTPTWTTNFDGAVRLELIRDAAVVQVLVASTTATQFTWQVPANLPIGNNYRLRLVNLNDNNRTALSNFLNVAVPDVRITAPNGGESLLGNNYPFTITWVNNTGRPVRLDLLRGGQVLQTIVATTTGTSRVWNLPDVPEATDYRLRVSIVGDVNVSDDSDANFAIVRPVITVVFPNGGENLIRDLRYNVTWQSNLGQRLVRILLVNAQGVTIRDITGVGGVEANRAGGFPWDVVPNLYPVGNNFRIRIVAVDNDRVIGESARDFSIINDNIAPVIANPNQPTLLDLGQASVRSLVASAVVTDNVRLATVVLRSRPITAQPNAVFDSRAAAEIQANTHFFSLPISDELGAEYFIEATDAAGNVSRTNRTTVNLRYSATSALTNIPEVRVGETVEDYQIVAVPLILDNPDAIEVFRDELGEYDPKTWRLFNYRDGANVEYGPGGFTNLEMGKGYWLIAGGAASPNGQPIPVTTGPGDGAKVSSTAPFRLELAQGWNQIGNPYRLSISWTDVRNANPSAGLGNLRQYRSGFVGSNILRSFQGGFVFVDLPTSITIPVARCSQCRVEEEPERLENPLSAPDWEVMFRLKAGRQNYELGGLGMRTDADPSRDRHDDMTVPRFGKYLELNFAHPEYFYPKFTKDVVPTAENHIWDFTVDANTDEKRQVLAWDNHYFGAGKNLVLFDRERQRFVNMHEAKEYAFVNAQGKYRFRAFFGDDAFITQNLQAEDIALLAYPNPIGQQASLAFTLPPDWDQAQVSLRVFNSLGQEVGQLASGSYRTGFHSAKWERGTLPAGAYLCVLEIAHQGRTVRKVQKVVAE
jgi:hypothetical protein